MVFRLTRIAAILFSFSVLVQPELTTAKDGSEDTGPVAQGKILAFERSKGNCLACHQIDGGDLAGNVGPALIDIREKYGDREELRALIWDASENNPNTMMPPFGRNRILTEKEIDAVLEFIYSL